MFDGDKNRFLTFEEFTLATEVHDTTEKLAWLFENIYDQVVFSKIKFFQKNALEKWYVLKIPKRTFPSLLSWFFR